MTANSTYCTYLELVADGGLFAGSAGAVARARVQVLKQLIHEVTALLDGILQVLFDVATRRHAQEDQINIATIANTKKSVTKAHFNSNHTIRQYCIS